MSVRASRRVENQVSVTSAISHDPDPAAAIADLIALVLPTHVEESPGAP